MKPHDKQIIHGSDDPNWGTPIEMYCALDAEFDFSVDLAASKDNHKHKVWIGPGGIWDNVITYPTFDRFTDSTAFINPPYSRELKISIVPFMTMCAVISKMFRIRIVAVLPASIQTRWWYANVWCQAHEIRLIPHRVNFEASPAMLAKINAKRLAKGFETITEAWNAGGNTAVVIWSPQGRGGIVGGHRPHVDYWSYRDNWEAEMKD